MWWLTVLPLASAQRFYVAAPAFSPVAPSLGGPLSGAVYGAAPAVLAGDAPAVQAIDFVSSDAPESSWQLPALALLALAGGVALRGNLEVHRAPLRSPLRLQRAGAIAMMAKTKPPKKGQTDNKLIKVVLKEKLEGKGNAGDIISVKHAYWENVLLRYDLAAPATADVLSRIAEEVAVREAEKNALLKEAKDKAAKMTSKFGQKGCFIEKKVGPDGNIFGSVTPLELSLILENQCGLYVDKKQMEIEQITPKNEELPATKPGQQGVKVVGETTATITFHKSVKATLKIVIIPEKK